MFNAKLADGTVISMADEWHIQELKDLRKKRDFYCPACQSQVQLKLGTTKIWHFAHYANQICSFSLERETVYHLNGKRQIYEWAKKQNIKVAMEVYLPLIKQRPDLLLRVNHTLYAIEYQCSPIDQELLENRSAGYEQLGITPIWLLGGNRLKRCGTNSFSIKSFEWSASRLIDGQRFLQFYCPEQASFVTLQQLTPYSPTRLLASLQETSLSQLCIEDILFPKNKTIQLLSQWLIVKKHWRYQSFPFKGKAEKFLQTILYKHCIPPSYFPIEAGWPSPHYELFTTSPCYWQTFLLLECIEHQSPHQFFSIQIAISCVQSSVSSLVFGIRFMKDGRSWSEAIIGYFQFLVQIGYLTEEKGQYKRMRNMVIPTSMDDAIMYDQTLYYQELMTMMNKRNRGNIKGISVEESNI
ncbi:competence protein CoiA [Halalkalibacter wakoensis JCM 9140]|uniref:Competence protein CoiA n=1 Tax=Halalkalibacter wakoensis JCM 9140 TaxID=1236970 RepID=W4Q1Q4_9BACI|nr:competence protein CoiA family protein [Halalkalibacter wakoensis]GAE25304.1 competence protein CoiA [Halalkalibacter wakoensis JCM 9140]